MIRRILIPLDPSAYADAAVAYGCAVAKQHDAELTGLVVLDIPSIATLRTPYPPSLTDLEEQLIASRISEAKGHIEELLAKFRSRCDDAGVRHRECEDQGSPSSRIVHDSMYYDLVITGLRTYYRFESQLGDGDDLSRILGHAIAPVLAVPQSAQWKDKQTAVIAFDGTFPAARALRQFAQLADPAEFDVTLVTAHDREDVARGCLDNAAAFLDAHGFADVERDWCREDIRDAVKTDYADWADLIVLGAHSKNRLLDFVTGSLTRDLIAAEKRPLLIGT